jgi:hypothetical protein
MKWKMPQRSILNRRRLSQSDYAKQQKFAAFHVLDKINTLREQFTKADENFQPIIEKQIKAAQSELEKVSSDPEAAVKYNNDVTEPVKEYLTKFIPKNCLWNGGLIVRHAQTDANVTGKENLFDEPLNEEGKKQANNLENNCKAQE